jgi:hypothetical protein
MIGRFLRVAAVLVVVVYMCWEIASAPPFLLLSLAFVGVSGLTIDSFINLPREVRELKAARAARDKGRPKWPRVPWGLDPVSAPAGVAIGLATEWWIGLAAWVIMTALLWVGWIWTRQFADGESELSRRAKRVVTVSFFIVHFGLMVAIFVQATVMWGDSGFLATLLGYGAWGFLGERLYRRRDEVQRSHERKTTLGSSGDPALTTRGPGEPEA